MSNSLRSQDNYNLEFEVCDLFILLFYSKVSKYSLEEFELAKSLFEKKNHQEYVCLEKISIYPKTKVKLMQAAASTF